MASVSGVFSGANSSTLMFLLFDSPSKAYYAGQNVTGRLVVRVQKLKKFRRITVICKGEAYVELKEDRPETDKDGHSRTIVVKYTGNEKYFENSIVVAGEMELQPGEYNFPFNFPIPQNVPSSFEGSYGYVRYTIKGEMERPWRFNHLCKTAFTVVCPLDLNLLPDVKNPVLEQRSKTFWSLFRKSGPLNLSVELPCSGYVPGQTIRFKIGIENESNVIVRRINSILYQEIEWIATWSLTKKRLQSKVIARAAVDNHVEPHSSKTFSQVIEIPPLPPSNLQYCNIIDIKYFIEVEVDAGTFHINLKSRVPITLGTVPLLTGPTKFIASAPPLERSAPENADDDPPPGELQPAVHNPDPSAAPSAAPPAYQDLPPPSYEECMFRGSDLKDKDDERTMGLTEFKPRYPVWKFDDQRT